MATTKSGCRINKRWLEAKHSLSSSRTASAMACINLSCRECKWAKVHFVAC